MNCIWKLCSKKMKQISYSLTFLAKNETLALPAESKTPKVEKIPAQPITGNDILMLLALREEVTYVFKK